MRSIRSEREWATFWCAKVPALPGFHVRENHGWSNRRHEPSTIRREQYHVTVRSEFQRLALEGEGRGIEQFDAAMVGRQYAGQYLAAGAEGDMIGMLMFDDFHLAAHLAGGGVPEA